MEPDSIQKILKLVEDKCKLSNETYFHNYGNENFCELIFDGIMCWFPTEPGILAIQPCSNDFIKSTRKGFATRQCSIDGKWYKSWSNFSECGKFYAEKNTQVIPSPTINNSNLYLEWLPIIKHTSQFGYTISILSLIISLLIFLTIKRLHCARNKLHTHLFVSFIMRSAMSLLKDALFVKGTALAHEISYVNGEPVFIKENYSWICKAIISLRNYFIISNYMLLLMEGLYLHNLMFLNLFHENGVTVYYFLGWGLPVIFIIPWIISKIIHENFLCWTQKTNKYIALFVDLPIGVAVVINFVLFIVIIRILFIKLTSMYIQQRKIKYRKLLRSTLILLPLFGIPYTISLILSFYITKSQKLEVIWLFFDQTFSAFQGLFVSLVYCLLNGDVQMEIKRIYSSLKDRNGREFKRRSRTISHTQQFPLTGTDDITQETNINH